MKFNKIVKNVPPGAITNRAGGVAFAHTPYTDLYTRCACTMVNEAKYYDVDPDRDLIRSIHKMLKIDPEFVLKLAVYAREKMHLRSVPLVLVAEYANVAPGTVPGAYKYVSRVIQRADEITELLAYQLDRNKRYNRRSKIPMCLKKGIRHAFDKFDEYSFAKYSRDNAAVKLRDAMFLTHPIPKNEEQKEVFRRIAEGNLTPPATWEVMRSTGKMTWKQVLHNIFWDAENGKVNNYMAMIRNLRNILKSPDITDEDVDLLCSMISDERAVSDSKLLPFRFYIAYCMVKHKFGDRYPSVLQALDRALMTSIKSLPRLAGKTLIAMDVSGSMDAQISQYSTMKYIDISLLLGVMASKFCDDVSLGIFGTQYIPVNPEVHLGDEGQSVLQMMARLRAFADNMHIDNGTFGHLIVKYLIENKLQYDRIIMVTDGQLWTPDVHDEPFVKAYEKYVKQYGQNTKLFICEVGGYGDTFIPDDTPNVYTFAGWSDEVLKPAAMMDENPFEVVEKIKNMTCV